MKRIIYIYHENYARTKHYFRFLYMRASIKSRDIATEDITKYKYPF